MSRFAYVNGRYLPLREAAVNVEDRGYQFADGIYEVIHVFDGRLIDAGRHLDRLERSLRELRLPAPMGRAALTHVVTEVARRNRVREGLIYMQVTRGVARRDHAFPNPPVPPALVVTARRTPPFPASAAANAVAAITLRDQRWARCDIKTVGLTANVLAKQAAREAGAAEAIQYDAQGMVTEGASSNVWIVDAVGHLRTRELSDAILPGCTRAALIALLDGTGVSLDERAFTLAELRAAREVFVTSATSFVKPVIRLDGAPVGEGTVGPVTVALFERFAAHVRGAGRNAR
ncbi:MAG: D-amino-acid transaminase [Acetobacteraceae bacterium]